MWYVPRKQHDKKCEDVRRQDPNNDNLCVQFHTQENNIDEIGVLIWNIRVAEVKQSMHNQRCEEKNMKVEYHGDIQRETHFGELRKEDG